ncbi:prepilin-type N-terminal cleavage/methylation domain-containing protein [Aquincola sp. S2]|uniref:Prepilin-type N-terminal cleavage/methylation domain-containing protein n=1 Tax=Pseudaquabacterium terrae TaxID=2732868 RepID=A0ABX2EAL5_9BURK|nr:prepilin-type N-terminal cleavage/methylation domain-containing protein [Aquabacterium terrae]NRF66141.1 prepilin-type N-terminal cleavage/methylation domain-containing protein [Aquabacterium terrae]
MPTQRLRGFTLIEIMITIAILAIITSIAMPSYTAYVMRSRVPAALDVLSGYTTKMELAYQDSGRYGTAATGCTAVIASVPEFNATCVLADATGQAYTATMTGHGKMAGYTYSINQIGARVTSAHPKGSNATCWTMKGGACDI